MNNEKASAVEPKIKKTNMTVVFFKRLSKSKSAMAGLIIILTLALIAILSPWIMPHSYTELNLSNAFAPPGSPGHLLGTDDLGRDILSRLMYGGRFSLRIGLFAVAVAMTVGTIIGATISYFGGKVDLVVMRLLDIFQSIPGLVLAIAMSAVLGPGFNNVIIALAVGIIPGYARMMRASAMRVRSMEYLEAATLINASKLRIILKHIFPNAIAPSIVQATMDVAGAILIAAGLSFIGLGVQPPDPEWGAMLSGGRGFIRNYPHLVVVPGVTIMIAVLSLNLLGDGLRDALDPKLRD